MAKLYELAKDLETAFQLLNENVDEETGEINPEAIELMKDCKMDFEEKVSSIVEFVKRLTADYEAYKKEEERLTKAKQSVSKKIDWLKNYIKECLTVAGKDKIKTTSCSVSLSTSHAVNVTDIDAIPAQFKTIEENVKVDKKAIADAFKNGIEVAGAEYLNNKNLRIS